MTKFDGFESQVRTWFRRLEAERPEHVRSTRSGVLTPERVVGAETGLSATAVRDEPSTSSSPRASGPTPATPLGRTLRAGDKRACEALVDAHHCALVALALTYVRFREVADEIVQETWVAVLAGIDRFRVAGHCQVYTADWSALPEEPLLGRETLDVVKRAIEGLSVAQRRVIAMLDIADLGADEVCDALGLSAGNQRVLLHPARSRVHAALEVHLDG